MFIVLEIRHKGGWGRQYIFLQTELREGKSSSV